MRKIIEIILTTLLIIIISLLFYLIFVSLNEKKAYDNLYGGEIYAELNTFNSKYYEDIMADIDDIDGVTVSNSRISDSEDDIVYLDETYYDKFKDDITFIDGTGFSSSDFVNIYDGREPLPMIITEKYSKENNVKVGDEVIIEDTLPSVCGLHTTWSTMMGGDEGMVPIKYPPPDTECDDLGQFAKISTQIVGIINSNEVSFIGNEIENPRILPTYIVNDENMQLYDLDSYLNHKPIYTNIMYNQWIFIDYSLISPQDFQRDFKEIEGDYSTPIDIYSETLNEQLIFQAKVNQEMQLIISLVYMFLILLILYLSYIFNILKYKEYKFSIYHLLGVKWNDVLKFELKNSLIIYFIKITLIIIILYYFKIKIILYIFPISIFLFLFIFENFLIILKYIQISKKNLSKIYGGGER